MPQVSIIIPTIPTRKDLLQRLLDSIEEAAGTVTYEVIIEDSEDDLLATKRNKGARKAQGEFFLFVDDDNVFQPDSIKHAVSDLNTLKRVAVLGFVSCYKDSFLIADGGSLRHMITGLTKDPNVNKRWSDIHKSIYPVDEAVSYTHLTLPTNREV